MKFLTLAALISSTAATVVWDGRFADYSTATDFDKWSWSNQVGSYQTYIYGNTKSQKASNWLTLSEFTTPSGKSAKQVKVRIAADSFWNSGPMLRTELIPQTNLQLTGKLYFHVSLKIPSVNQPNPNYEHQIVFWESHASEIKYGTLQGQSGGTPNTLRFLAGGNTQWSLVPKLDTWYNFVFETGGSGGLWFSEGGAALTKAWSGNAGDGGKEWHVGQLRLNGNDMKDEEIFYSGIYIEDSLTTAA